MRRWGQCRSRQLRRSLRTPPPRSWASCTRPDFRRSRSCRSRPGRCPGHCTWRWPRSRRYTRWCSTRSSEPSTRQSTMRRCLGCGRYRWWGTSPRGLPRTCRSCTCRAWCRRCCPRCMSSRRRGSRSCTRPSPDRTCPPAGIGRRPHTSLPYLVRRYRSGTCRSGCRHFHRCMGCRSPAHTFR